MNRGQPRGLYLLFFTELWERFGFYMVQTILVLYLSKGLSYTDDAAYLLYGAFTSMLYLFPVVGGYIADRFIGFRQGIILGGVLFMIGYALMALPNPKALFIGMGFVILGNGFFKPNVSSLVGDLYEPGDPRRDGGFTIFYMGINIGSLLPPLFAGALVAAYTWGSGFLVASVGMVVSLITFLVGQKRLQDVGQPPKSGLLSKGIGYKVSFYALLFGAVLVTVGVLNLLLLNPAQSNLILVFASLVVIGCVLFFLFKEMHEQRRKMVACLILIVLSIGFWAIYNQTFTSMMLFADRNMSKEFLGLTINPEFTQFFNPFFITVLSPLLARFWVYLDGRGKNPSTPLKFSLGILAMAIGYLTLSFGVYFFNNDGLASPWWLALSYFIQTCGELLISPIGLAMVTKLSPKHLVGVMMGVWFLTQSAAFAIGGTLATLSSVPDQVKGIESLDIYAHGFAIYGAISLSLAILSFILIPYLKKLIGHSSGPIMTPKR